METLEEAKSNRSRWSVRIIRAKNAALYNTFIETCKQAGISFRDYFRQVILALKSGRTDYENLLPMTIALEK